jgi:hypothetical protein
VLAAGSVPVVVGVLSLLAGLVELARKAGQRRMDGERLVLGIGGLLVGGYWVLLWSQDRRGIRRHVRPGFNRNWMPVTAAVFLLMGASQLLQGLVES